MLCKVVMSSFFGVISCFTALMLCSLVLQPRSVRTVRARFQLLRNADILPPIDGLPVQAPPGLNTARQTYVFEKIREICNEEDLDITCPAPKSRAGQKQALRIQIPLFMRGSDGPVIITICSASIQMTLSQHMPYVVATIIFLSCCSATLPLIVCI